MTADAAPSPNADLVVASVDGAGGLRLQLDSSVMSQAVYLYRAIRDDAGSVVDLEILMLNEAARKMPFSDGMVPGARASEVFVDTQLALDAANAVIRGDIAGSYAIERSGLLEGSRLVVRYDVSTFGVVLPGTDGEVGVGQVALDRTWMTHATEADQRFRLMAESSHDGLMLLTADHDGTLLVEFANPVVQRNDPRLLVGYPLPADLASFAKDTLAGLPVGGVVRRELQSMSTVRHVSVDVVFTRLNDDQVLVTVRELTSEQLARAELERSDTLLRAIGTGAFGTLAVLEPVQSDGHVVHLRASWSASGRSHPAGRAPLEASEMPAALLVEAANSMRATRTASHFGWVTIRDRAGEERSLEFALVDAGDRFVLEFVERTDELVLRTQLAAVTAAAEAQRAFLSRISHELRSPLNVIHGYTQLLARMYLPGLADRHVEHIERGVRRMVSVIDDLLLLGHLDQGLLRLEQRPTLLDDVIDEVQRKLATALGDDAALPTVLPPVGAVTVRTDPSRLSDALTYLVIACVEAAAGERLEFGAYRRGTTLGLQIAAAADSPLPAAVWRPFVDGEGLPGNGLGLAVARALLESLGVACEVRASSGTIGDTALVLPLEAVT